MRFTTPSWAARRRSRKARLVAAPRQFLQHDRRLLAQEQDAVFADASFDPR
jgi:hypothetical protein